MRFSRDAQHIRPAKNFWFNEYIYRLKLLVKKTTQNWLKIHRLQNGNLPYHSTGLVVPHWYIFKEVIR